MPFGWKPSKKEHTENLSEGDIQNAKQNRKQFSQTISIPEFLELLKYLDSEIKYALNMFLKLEVQSVYPGIHQNIQWIYDKEVHRKILEAAVKYVLAYLSSQDNNRLPEYIKTLIDLRFESFDNFLQYIANKTAEGLYEWIRTLEATKILQAPINTVEGKKKR